MKLHIGCGDVYLRGYINIDIEGKYVREASEQELEANSTTLNKYFKFPFGTLRRNIILDKKMDILAPWDIPDNSVDEIVMISVIEHVSHKDAEFVAKEVKRVLKPFGKALIDFPDLKEQFFTYYETNPKFYMELVYCNHKNKYSVHHWGYTRETFKELFGTGFIYNYRSIVNHDYPTIGVELTCLKFV